MGCRLKVLRRNAWKGTGRHIESTLKYLVLLKPFLILAIFMLVYASGAGSFAHASDPGWKMVSAPPVSPDEARQTLAECEGLVTTSHQLRGMATSETEATPEIVELARALKHDPRLIFDYVRNHIDYVPTFGSVNGATATLLAGRGNDFDQASLFIALMSASGYTANYVQGDVLYSLADVANWLGVDKDAYEGEYPVALCVLARGGIPVLDFSSSTIKITRVWARPNIGGTYYEFDHAFKQYEYTGGINVPQAMGYSQASFLASARAGATIGSDYVKNMNEGNIRSNLENYSINLVNHIKENHPNASVREIIGGRKILYEELEEYPTTLPHAIQIENQTEWTEIPDNYRLKLRIQHAGIDYTFASYQIAGKRVSIFYTGSGNAPELKVDGTLIATGNSTNPGTTYDLTLSVDHPYAANGGKACDEEETYQLKSGSSYVIVSDFEGVSKDLIRVRNTILTQNRLSGTPEQSDAVLGEALNIMGLTWLHECKLSEVLIAQLADAAYVHHHSVGVMAQEEGYYIDVKLSIVSHTSVAGHQEDGWAWFRTTSGIGSAFEHGILEQLQGEDKPGASTVKLLQISNSNSKKTFYADSNNFDSIKGQLQNYGDEYDQNSLMYQVKQAVNAGYKVILPEDAHIDLNEWRGAGYIKTYAEENNASVGMIISGNYYGGYGGYQEPVYIPRVHNETRIKVPDISTQVYISTPKSIEPVDMASGAYLYDHTDLSLGKQEPLGLHFARSYNSSANYEKRSLGYGCTHNYDIYLQPHSHGDPGLGARLPVDAASAIAGFYVAFDLMKDHDDLQGWLITSLAQKWAIDQLIDNAVTVHLGGKSLEYIKLADGAYSPPPCVTTELIDNGATFTLEERFDTSLDFNTDNRINSWQDADGNTLTFTYSGDKLQTIQDTFNRTLTLSYSGDYISSVSDSTGRSVSYQYSGDNLTGYTDPEGHNWSYSYSDHRMETITDPLSVVMATNVYDDLGRVKTQTNGNNKTYQFYFSTYRNIEEDPDGNPIIYYFDQEGRQIGQEDALENRGYTTYDGQGHVISVTDPRENTTEFEYDGDHNRTKMIDALSHETTYTYDTQHRLTATTDPLNHATHFHYDNEHHLTLTTDPEQNDTSFAYYPNGLVHTKTDANNVTTTYTYDSYGNLASEQTGNGDPVNYTYNARGWLEVVTDQHSAVTQFSYDKRGLMTSKIDPEGNTTQYQYYSDGNLQWKKYPADGGPLTISYTYTGTDKVDIITYPDASTVDFDYDNRDNVHTMTDTMDTTTYTHYDNNWLETTTNPYGFQVRYQYNAAGNLEYLTYPGNKVVHYEYDQLNRLHRVTPWAGQTIVYSRDDGGRLERCDLPNGTLATYSYDDASRLTDLINRKSDTSIISSYHFSLDGVGNRTGITRTEPFAPMFSPGTTPYTYNGNHHLLLTAGEEAFSYDQMGNLVSRTGGTSVSYAYDYEQSLKSIAGEYLYGELEDFTTFDEVDVPENRVEVTPHVIWVNEPDFQEVVTVSKDYGVGYFSGDFEHQFEFQQTSPYRPYAMTYIWQMMNPGWTNALILYAEDTSLYGAGLHIKLRINGPHNQSGNAHDFNIRLPDLNAKYYFTVKRVGLRFSCEIYTDPERTQLFGTMYMDELVARDYQFLYMVENNTVDYIHNFDTMSCEISNLALGAEGAEYFYDGAGRRLEATRGGDLTLYIHDASGNVLAETDNTGQITKYYIYGIGLVAMITDANQIYTYHFNAVGSTMAITDASEKIVNKYSYDSFGTVGNQVEKIEQPFKFVGQHGVMAEPNGLYFMRARYYDPGLGRFLQPDPIGFGGGDVNLYVYCGNNPILLIDPYGNDWISTGLGFGSYVLNTVGMVYAPAKGAGVFVSLVAIGYSGAQYKLGNMSGEEAAANVSCAAADIVGVGVGALKPVAGIIASGVSRAFGVSNTAIDAVRTAGRESTPTPTPTPSVPSGKGF